ncbi:MAG: DUF4258 domain-containing protein [Patescibacteria group bacterium]
MDYILTDHARKRMVERSISKSALENALRSPSKVLYDDADRLLIKKLYKNRNKARLLIIIGETSGNKFKIITVIETSKIKKYL